MIRRNIVLICFVAYILCACAVQDQIKLVENDLIDLSDLEDAFTANSLPTDERYMCSIGNGHVATDVFSDSVYMNGLYNGERGDSHRARVPAWCNIQLMLNDTVTIEKPSYTLNTAVGAFIVNVETEQWEVEQRIYAHRFYTRAIINQFVVKSKIEGSSDAEVKIILQPGLKSTDVSFEDPTTVVIQNRTIWTMCGKTLAIEDKRYQKEASKVCAFWTDVPHSLKASETNSTYTFIMTVDSKKEVAQKEMLDILQLNEEDLYNSHKFGWKKLLDSGKIEIEGNLGLSKTVNGVWYFLLSSLPSLNSNQPTGRFYGLSPGGLSRGGYLKDYQGHSFWDTETWMFPAVLTLQPELAKRLLDYRTGNSEAAADLAELSGHEGIRFSWESAFTGAEVTPDCCPEVVDFEHHITGCIAFAARQYISMTGDKQWLNSSGCSMISKIADFWASRAEFNVETGFYDIKGVMGPDEDHPNVTNSVFTNVVAGLALYLGDYASCLCNSTNTSKSEWTDVASKLNLPYDHTFDYHPQYDGYERSTIIKQADAVLLGFPLMYKMHPKTRENDLLYYENVTRDNGPAMTWSMHTVGHLQLGNNDQAASLFNRSYQPYVRQPFKIWTEAREPEIGAVNFITGMGGFLQAIMFGYAGINIHLDKLEIVNPQLIPDTTRLKINGIKFHGSNFTLDIGVNRTELQVDTINPNQTLVLHIDNSIKIPLFSGISVPLPGKGPFQITRDFPEKCPLPLDMIGQQFN
ncbi:protein-glucosylgalactosylhydroxylysine glucosidase-like [Arctopsyche grandis]|uniref:protein-glucosylgalactosylhydroxylysine glucosidase-like n=1 Tax=Arctopsyche grandis TaxID=121162 RepID=UPI00406D6944